MEDLNWTEAMAFCEQLTIRERNAGRIPADWAYVLPTESQWEYACRAGTTTVYFWGDDMNSSHANYSASGVGETGEVGQYAANPWGFFDMHGNVWEWTADWYAVYPSENPTIDPTGPASGSLRVYRGGSRSSDRGYLRSAKRYGRSPRVSAITISASVLVSKKASNAQPPLSSRLGIKKARGDSL